MKVGMGVFIERCKCGYITHSQSCPYFEMSHRKKDTRRNCKMDHKAVKDRKVITMDELISENERLANEVKHLTEKVAELSERPKNLEEQLSTRQLCFGGGYLTAHEANHLLNNLPLEISFIDKNDIVKYFNERSVSPEEMMFVRTKDMLGADVADSHPSKSHGKVMPLVRDLKAGKRDIESMWFKKKNQYIHVSFKAIFDENGEYLGIMEYVQDIQPFFELPSEMKVGLRDLDESN